MCVTFLWINDECAPGDANNWQLVLLNNRDEIYSRPALPADWDGDVICSRDMEPGREGGTWLGMNIFGKLAFIHNINYPVPLNADQLKGRGNLVKNFVHGKRSESPAALSYAEEVSESGHLHNGFYIVLIEKMKDGASINNNIEEASWRVVQYSNRDDKGVESLKAGIHAFGNCPLDRPFRKVQKGKDNFKNACHKWASHRNVEQFVDSLLSVLTDKEECFPDDTLVKYQPALSADTVRYMSSCFVEFPLEYNYGTRTHTIILIDGAGSVTYIEKNIDNPVSKKWSTRKYLFNLRTTKN